jgi:N-acetylglucosamine kinase-like BadF-type ATPase
MALYLGIDGGGTKTECALAQGTTILARARGAACKIQRVGREQARAALHQTIQQACTQASVDPGKIRRACIGLAGAGNQEVAELARELVAELVPGEIEVVGDMAIALEAAFPGAPGLVVITGTGSIAYGRNPRGETARAGGLGPVVSDEGSGAWIGRQAVAAVLRAHDTGQSTPLAPAILGAWKIATYDELVRLVHAQPPPDFAALVPHVLRTAEAGGPLAREVLTQAGTELANLAKIVMRRLWPGPQPLPVAMAGGVFENSSLVRKVFRNSLLAERPQARIVKDVVEPVLGALALARKASAEVSPER